jgi:hypothetical protein
LVPPPASRWQTEGMPPTVATDAARVTPRIWPITAMLAIIAFVLMPISGFVALVVFVGRGVAIHLLSRRARHTESGSAA